MNKKIYIQTILKNLQMFCADYILSQSYNATEFYFDNISFLEHELNHLLLPNESSISQASYRTKVFKDSQGHTAAFLHNLHKVKFLKHLCHIYITSKYGSHIIITCLELIKISNITVNSQKCFAFNLSLDSKCHFRFTVSRTLLHLQTKDQWLHNFKVAWQ